MLFGTAYVYLWYINILIIGNHNSLFHKLKEIILYNIKPPAATINIGFKCNKLLLRLMFVLKVLCAKYSELFYDNYYFVI